MYTVNATTLAVGTTMFLLKYKLLQVSTFPGHLHASSIVRFKKYTNLFFMLLIALREDKRNWSKHLHIYVYIY